MSLTKEEVNILLCEVDLVDLGKDTGSFLTEDELESTLRRALYLAAGLTAEGERKPERVRCWRYKDGSIGTIPAEDVRYGPTTPGWFVPDGAE